MPRHYLLILLGCGWLVGCADETYRAPVVDVNERAMASATHSELREPIPISARADVLSALPPTTELARNQVSRNKAADAYLNQVKNQPWRWPTEPAFKTTSQPQGKGLIIHGLKGSSIYATLAGQVVYAGQGIRGYGNLLIVKHAPDCFSAYGLNQAILVAEGEQVKSGQKIAEMGVDESNKPSLYFEVRFKGHSIKPLSLFYKELAR